jgi:hypothetical protein
MSYKIMGIEVKLMGEFILAQFVVGLYLMLATLSCARNFIVPTALVFLAPVNMASLSTLS